MENNNNIEKFLSNKMLLEELNLPEPDLNLVSEARKKISSRKKSSHELEDFFSLIAVFLNLKIKLYHAVIATVIIGGVILFFNKEDKGNKTETHSSQYVSNIASVRSSTILPSICTFD